MKERQNVWFYVAFFTIFIQNRFVIMLSKQKWIYSKAQLRTTKWVWLQISHKKIFFNWGVALWVAITVFMYNVFHLPWATFFQFSFWSVNMRYKRALLSISFQYHQNKYSIVHFYNKVIVCRWSNRYTIQTQGQ